MKSKYSNRIITLRITFYIITVIFIVTILLMFFKPLNQLNLISFKKYYAYIFVFIIASLLVLIDVIIYTIDIKYNLSFRDYRRDYRSLFEHLETKKDDLNYKLNTLKRDISLLEERVKLKTNDIKTNVEEEKEKEVPQRPKELIINNRINNRETNQGENQKKKDGVSNHSSKELSNNNLVQYSATESNKKPEVTKDDIPEIVKEKIWVTFKTFSKELETDSADSNMFLEELEDNEYVLTIQMKININNYNSFFSRYSDAFEYPVINNETVQKKDFKIVSNPTYTKSSQGTFIIQQKGKIILE